MSPNASRQKTGKMTNRPVCPYTWGGVLWGGTVLARILHDGPMLLAVCRATPYCRANVAQLRSSLSETRDVASLWRYGVCLSHAKRHWTVTADFPKSTSCSYLLKSKKFTLVSVSVAFKNEFERIADRYIPCF